MLRKLRGRPLWYQAWAAFVAAGAIYVLGRVFSPDGLNQFDYGVMVFVHVSILIDLIGFPKAKGEESAT